MANLLQLLKFNWLLRTMLPLDALAGPPLEFRTADGAFFRTADGIYFGVSA